MKIGYGLTSTDQAHEIASRVVDVLGGGEFAYKLLIETSQQETKIGEYPDKSAYGAGIGLNQCDPIAFHDTKDRTSSKNKELIKESFGIDIDSIQHRELAYSPLLSFIWCRLHYLLRPGAIPSSVEYRGRYWKRWYNSFKGAGTVEEYVLNAGKINPIC